MAEQEPSLQRRLSRRKLGIAVLGGSAAALLRQPVQEAEGATLESSGPFVDLDIGKEQFNSPLVYPIDATGFFKIRWSTVDTLLAASMNPTNTSSPYTLSAATYERDGTFSPFAERLSFGTHVQAINSFTVTGDRSVVITGQETGLKPIIGKVVLDEQPTVSYHKLESGETGSYAGGVEIPDDPAKLLYLYTNFRGINPLNPKFSDIRFEFRIFDQQTGEHHTSESMTAAHLPDIVYRSDNETIVTIGRGVEIVGEGFVLRKPRQTKIDPKTGTVLFSGPFAPRGLTGLAFRPIDGFVLDTTKHSPILHAFSSEGGQGVLTTVDLDHPERVKNVDYKAELKKFDSLNDNVYVPSVLLTSAKTVGDTLWTAGIYGQIVFKDEELVDEIGMIFAPWTLDSSGFIRGVNEEGVIRLPMPHGAEVPPIVKKLDFTFFPSANRQERLGTPGLLADVNSYGFVFVPLDKEKEIVYPDNGLPRTEMETPPENKTSGLRLGSLNTRTRQELDAQFAKKLHLVHIK